jgi:hypothetical protein
MTTSQKSQLQLGLSLVIMNRFSLLFRFSIIFSSPLTLCSQADKVTFCTTVPRGTVQSFPANRLHRGVGPTHASKKRYLFFFYTWPCSSFFPGEHLQLNPWVSQHLLDSVGKNLSYEQAVFYHVWNAARIQKKGKTVQWSVYDYFTEDDALLPFMNQVKQSLSKKKFPK